MPDTNRPVVGPDGELLVDAAPAKRKRKPGSIRWLLLAGIMLGAAALAAVWSAKPGSVTPTYYRAHLVEEHGTSGSACQGWHVWGIVSNNQPRMTMQAQTSDGRIYQGLVHHDTGYQIILNPQPGSLSLNLVLLGADGQALSDPFAVRFSGNQKCIVQVNFDGGD